MVSDQLDPPLRIDWLVADELNDGAPGRLGMTFLPGKNGASHLYPGRVYRRDVDRDLDTLREGGVRHMLLLIEDAELARWGDLEIVNRAAEHGVTIDRYPLPDGSAPQTVREMDDILSTVNAARGFGDVAVACMGGVGRTGTVVACALVAAGSPSSEAIARVREVRHPNAVETEEQMLFVQAYERHLGKNSQLTRSVKGANR